MVEYRDGYLLTARVEGTEKIDQAVGSITRAGEVLRRLNSAAIPLQSGLQSLDKQLGLSSQTLASYDKLLRVFNDLDSAKRKLAETQIAADLPIKAAAGSPQAQIIASSRVRAVQDATSAVDRRQEAVFKELRTQLGRDLATQERAERDAASQATRNAANIRRASYEFQQTLKARNEAVAKQVEQARLSGVDRTLASRPVQTTLPADLSTHVGRAQSGVDQAETALKLANLRLASERTSESRTVASVIAAENKVAAADSALASSRERLALLQTRTSGSVFEQFRTGFKGTNADRSYPEQIGQAFKFSVFYGTAYKLLFGITQTLQATLQEGIQFQQAMTELTVAAGRPADELNGLADSLGSQSVQAGFAPSQGVLVGARSLGLFGVAGGTGPGGAPTASEASEQDRVAEISSRVVSRIALGSGLQPADIQSNLAAIAQAFGTGAEGQVRAYDLDAFLTRKFGVAPGSTLAPVSEAGTVGKAAGFSQEQVTAIAADLMSRTGTTPEAVAGYMAQIFSRSGEGALNTLDQKYGVDQNKPLVDQFAQLAKVYAKNPDARDEISAAFGRGKVQNAVIALLQDYPEVQKQAKAADRGAQGEGDKQSNLRLQNLGGQIAITGGVLKDFADQLGRSGILADLGVFLVVVRELVSSATGLLREWNQLPGVIRQTAIALAALAVAAKVGGVGSIIGGEGSALVGGRHLAASHRLESGAPLGLARNAALGNVVTSAATGETTYLASRAGATTLARNAANAAGGFGVAAAVLGDVYLWGALSNSTRKFAEAQDFATKTLNKSIGPNASPAELKAQAAALGEAATQSRDSTKGVFHDLGILGTRFSLGGNDADALAQANRADAQAKQFQALARYKQNLESAAPASTALVSGFDADSLTASMQAITDTGGTARDRLDALNATLLGTADAASRVKAAFDPHLFAGSNAPDLAKKINNSVFLGSTQYNPLDPGEFFGKAKTSNIGADRISGALSSDDIRKRLQDSLTNVDDLGSLKNGDLREIADSVLGDTAQKAFGDLDPDQIKKAQSLMRRAIVRFLKRQAKDTKDILSGNTQLDATQLTTVVNQSVADTQELINSLPENDYAGRIKAAQDGVRDLVAYIGKAKDGPTSASLQALDNARKAVAEAQIGRLEALRKAAQHVAHGDREVASVGRGFFVREVNAAIRGGDTDALVNLVQTAGNYGISIARKAIENALAVARAAISTQAQVAAFASAELAGIRGIGQVAGGGGPTSKQQRHIDKLQGLLSALGTSTPGVNGDDVFATGSDAGRPDAAAADTGETALQRQAALASANATRSESAIQQARAAVLSARADMASAKKGTVEYYNALSSYYDARNQLTDAILEYRNNQYLLGHDITNPLVQARAQLVAAQAKLRSDAGKPADVRAADEVAVRQARADAESTAFSQRLDAVQTAESLGRISYSAYINYLNHERDRLKGIAHRSYQQQQELNQVDQLLKTASDQMQGQWNFGDIKLPTPYQVRRAIEQQSGNPDGGGFSGPGRPIASVTNHNVRIMIDGADTGQILKILRQYVGRPGRTMTTGTRHR